LWQHFHSLARINRTCQPAEVADHNDAATYYVGSFLKEISVIVGGSVELPCSEASDWDSAQEDLRVLIVGVQRTILF
jgi:hypothetical protein